jgi:hypothetical protein
VVDGRDRVKKVIKLTAMNARALTTIFHNGFLA